jgi:hypothetical protein
MDRLPLPYKKAGRGVSRSMVAPTREDLKPPAMRDVLSGADHCESRYVEQLEEPCLVVMNEPSPKWSDRRLCRRRIRTGFPTLLITQRR